MAAESQTPTTEEQDSETLAARFNENIGTTNERVLDARMPSSVSDFIGDMKNAHGRTFACPKCGEATTGTCDNCGHTHAKLRRDPGE